MENNVDKKEVVGLFNLGMKQADIARKFLVTRQRINTIVKKRKGVRYQLYKKVMRKDGGRCFICNVRFDIDKNLVNIHHIDFSPANNNLDNLVTLCRNCHLLVHREKNETYE